MDRKTGEFENGRWRAGAQGLYAEYGNRVLLKHLLLNAGTFYHLGSAREVLSGATSGDVMIGATSGSERGVNMALERRIGRLAAEYVFSSENVSIDGGKLRILHESEMG